MGRSKFFFSGPVKGESQVCFQLEIRLFNGKSKILVDCDYGLTIKGQDERVRGHNLTNADVGSYCKMSHHPLSDQRESKLS